MSDPLDTSWVPVVEKIRAGTAGELIIGGELGHGGMAAVFLAYDTRLNRRVAIKVMAPPLLMGQGLVQRFAEEAVTMANLRHPNIITVHSVRQIDDVHFFVMEFVAGRALDRIIERAGALPLAVARAILWQVGSALNYAHRRGVIHRDIKPANILIDEDGRALVTDFGIAKVVESPMRTQSGILVGTPAYMSPEQCYALPVDQATDQYSLGVAAYEMLTGHAPFSGSSFSVMQAHALDAPPAMRDVRPDLPAEVEHAVLRMLAKEPTDRWPTIREALAALGAHPLDDGDSVHTELAHLATLGAAPAATSESLTPPGRRRPVSPPPMPSSGGDRLFLIVAEPPASISVGDEFALTAVLCREQGTIVADRRVEWTSSDPQIARVEKTSGVVRALAPGKATIVASAAGMTDPVIIDVRPAVRPAIPKPRRSRSNWIGASALGVVLATAAAVSLLSGGTEPLEPVIPIAPTTPPPAVLDSPVVPVARAPERDTTPGRRDSTGVARVRAAERIQRQMPQATVQPSVPAAAVIARDSAVVAPPPIPAERPPVLDTVIPSSIVEPDRPTESHARAAAAECAEAVRGKQFARLIELFHGAPADRRALDDFIALVRDEGAKLVISAPVYGQSRAEDASADFSVKLTWRSSFGGQRSSVLRFRAEVGKVGGEWRLTGCRIVG